ncbi:MAG: hypothetical protein ACOC2W_03375, partial [bacterium]
HPVANALIKLDDDNYLNDKVTLLDYDEDDYAKLTYTIPSKLVDTLSNITGQDKEEIRTEIGDKGSRYIHQLISMYDNHGLMTKNRTSTTINKVVNKLFPGKYDASGNPGFDLESFKEMVVSKRKELDKAFDRFKVVEGDDILKYYHYNSYSDESKNRGSNLYGSCMKYDSCQEYLKFYSENEGVKLVVLMSNEEEDKIDGRALLWDIENVDGEDVERKFMDRIYFTYSDDVQLFKSFAKKNGWLNKKSQNMHSDEKIEDLKNDDSGYWELRTTTTFRTKGTYPYMDTMKFFYHDEGFLSNYDNYGEEHYFLEDTRGGYEDNSGIYVEYYGRTYPEEDLIYCGLGDEWRLNHEAIYIDSEGEYATEWYVDHYFVYSESKDQYIRGEDAVYSEYLQDYIHIEEKVDSYKEGAAEYDSLKEIPSDYDDHVDEYTIRYDNFIEYNPIEKGWGTLYFHPDDEKQFVEAYSTKRKDYVNAHKKWDKDKLHIKDGKYYLFDGDQEEIDRIIGQYRLFDNKNNII